MTRRADGVDIVAMQTTHIQSVVALALRAWAPVFPQMERAIPDYVYQAFYPDGWRPRQSADVQALCEDASTSMFVAVAGAGEVVGFVGVRAHPADAMGEIHILAVDPLFQRRGVGRALLDHGFDWMRARGLAMAMVETGDDPGHAPSRSAYEAAGFERYPVARYFRKL